MRVAVSGSSGLVGTALCETLRADGHDIHRFVRPGHGAGPATIAWDPDAGTVDVAALDGADAVVHLAGEGIAEGRWTRRRKRRIRDSRVVGTRAVAEAMTKTPRLPRVLLCASAVGWYGPHGDEPLDETAPAGTDFLATLCRDWEAAADPARAAGIRVVHMRTGIVLCAKGGALAKMLPPFKMGLGGVLGSGEQVMSWIELDDLVGAYRHALVTDVLEGPVNATAPNPVTNREFTRTLGRVLRRPTILPMPGFAARLVFGEMAGPLLLSGQRVLPARLAASGYPFRYPVLDAALAHALGR